MLSLSPFSFLFNDTFPPPSPSAPDCASLPRLRAVPRHGVAQPQPDLQRTVRPSPLCRPCRPFRPPGARVDWCAATESTDEAIALKITKGGEEERKTKRRCKFSSSLSLSLPLSLFLPLRLPLFSFCLSMYPERQPQRRRPSDPGPRLPPFSAHQFCSPHAIPVLPVLPFHRRPPTHARCFTRPQLKRPLGCS